MDWENFTSENRKIEPQWFKIKPHGFAYSLSKCFGQDFRMNAVDGTDLETHNDYFWRAPATTPTLKPFDDKLVIETLFYFSFIHVIS